MKPILSDLDRQRLDQRVKETEKRTGAQIVLAVVQRSDAYTEIPWIAFALGASMAGLWVCLRIALSSGWFSQIENLISVGAILGTGAVFALLTVLIPAFARVFLLRHRAETEVRQYAESLFLRRELFATTERTGILLLVSLFERRIVLLPDKGIESRVSENAMKEVIGEMIQLLKRNHLSDALETGLEHLSQCLTSSTFTPSIGSRKDELPDQIIEEKGV